MLFFKGFEKDGEFFANLTNVSTSESLTISEKDCELLDTVYPGITFKKMQKMIVTDEDFEKVKEKLFNFSNNTERNNILDDLGIIIDTNGDVSLKDSDIVFPKDSMRCFRDIKTLEDGKKFIKFCELLSNNPREYVRDGLVNWLANNPTVEIDEDGRLLGYRGVQDNMLSYHKGYGIVNGKEYNDYLDNSPGNIIEFPVPLTDHSYKMCSVGLHIGTLSYARGFGRRFVKVAFSPADVISAFENSHWKIRVSKMEIMEELSKDKIDEILQNDVEEQEKNM